MFGYHNRSITISIILVAVASGCGDSRFTTAPVEGQAEFAGEPVSAGTIIFTPVGADGSPRAGKSAVGVVQSDGTFVMRTYEDDDGAIIGQHRVYYSSPEADAPESIDIEQGEDGQENSTSTANDPSTEDGTALKLQVADISSIVEVKAGDKNTFTIELAEATDDDDDDGDD